MSLYQLSKFMYALNRDEQTKRRFRTDPAGLIADYRLSDEERGALLDQDVGLLYVLGVNGQLLMHFAALCEIDWADYLQQMRDGVKRHGPVRAGIYAMTTSPDEKIAG